TTVKEDFDAPLTLVHFFAPGLRASQLTFAAGNAPVAFAVSLTFLPTRTFFADFGCLVTFALTGLTLTFAASVVAEPAALENTARYDEPEDFFVALTFNDVPVAPLMARHVEDPAPRTNHC